MNKTIVCPNIVIYHDAFSSYSDVIDLFKESEKLKEKKYSLPPSKKWLMYGSITQVDGSRDENIYSDNADSLKQKKVFQAVYDAYDKVIDDFFNNHLDKNVLPSFVKNFDISNTDYWVSSGISMLKYDIKNDEQYRTTPHMNNRVMGYHTDTNSFDIESRGYKLVVTVTMYLNDDYDGGEICFFDTVSGQQYAYKPKPGDITVFPSGEPYWHSVLPSYNAERYLLRIFCMYNYPGTKKWLENEKKFGKDEWANMEKARMQEVWDSASSQTIVVFPGEEEPINSPYKVLKMDHEPIKIIASIDKDLDSLHDK